MLFERISYLDGAICQKFQSIRIGNRLDRFLRFYTRIGDGYVWLIIMAYILFFRADLWTSVLFKILFIGTISVAIYVFIKNTIKRPRPFSKHAGIKASLPALDNYSFPSGHVMNNLAISGILVWTFPWLTISIFLIPISWGILRVYYGVHYVSDVLAGIILGLFCFQGGNYLYLILFS